MAERYIPEHRRTQFKAKNTFKPEELRRRREEQQVEIRKAKREENLAKRRGLAGDGANRPGASLGAAPDSDDEGIVSESQVSDYYYRGSAFYAGAGFMPMKIVVDCKVAQDMCNGGVMQQLVGPLFTFALSLTAWISKV